MANQAPLEVKEYGKELKAKNNSIRRRLLTIAKYLVSFKRNLLIQMVCQRRIKTRPPVSRVKRKSEKFKKIFTAKKEALKKITGQTFAKASEWKKWLAERAKQPK